MILEKSFYKPSINFKNKIQSALKSYGKTDYMMKRQPNILQSVVDFSGDISSDLAKFQTKTQGISVLPDVFISDFIPYTLDYAETLTDDDKNDFLEKATSLNIINIANIPKDSINNIKDAYSIAKNLSPILFENLTNITTNIYIYENNVNMPRAFSYMKMNWSIFIKGSHYSPWEFFEFIIHETCHIGLGNIELDQGAQFKEESEKFIFYSPLRKKNRTLRLTFHATFVALNLALVYKRVLSRMDLKQHEKTNIKGLLQHRIQESKEGIEVIGGNLQFLEAKTLDIFSKMQKSYHKNFSK